MRRWLSLTVPAALAAAGFLIATLVPHAVAPRAVAASVGWLALAWTVARLCDLLLLGRATPYPRLLADLLRVALFAAAAAILLEEPIASAVS